MKRTTKTQPKAETDDMLPHYDFSGGVRGKHFKKFREGIDIQLLESGKRTTMVVLDDDLGKLFPDSKAVNDALRHLLAAMPSSSGTRRAVRK